MTGYALVILRGAVWTAPVVTDGPRGAAAYLEVRTGEGGQGIVGVIARDPGHMQAAAALNVGDDVTIKGALSWLVAAARPRTASAARVMCQLTMPAPTHTLRRGEGAGEDQA